VRASLRLLVVEDSEDDALLVVRELRRAGYNVTFERVDTPESMGSALARQTWDLILSDYTMPHFSGIAALELLKETGLDIPFIIISGSIGEDLAVAAMKAGAHDYLMKGNIRRLLPSVERELREAEGRRQHRRAEEALQESEARKGAILDSAPDCIVTIDHEGKIIELNPAAERTFGYNSQELLGRPMADLVMAPFLQNSGRQGAQLYSVTEDPGIGKRIEITARRADGAEFPVELTVTRISRKGPPMFTAYIHDLTEQKRQEEIRRRSEKLQEQNRLIQEASRLKSEFLANMSHELRTPLNAVIGFSELMIDQKAGPVNAQQSEYLTDILASGRHLLQLINDVLDLAKIEAGKMELDLHTFSFRKAVDEVCTVMRSTALRRNIRIDVNLDSSVDFVTLDERKLKQVLYNLLSNAVKFSHENGKIEVVGGEGLGQICLQVKDLGIGIKKEDLPRLFREFEQLGVGTARQHEGTGLGLALTKKIVELQQGTIGVESEFGKGSTFTVTLPDRFREL
jgi:PAS domain S-box-containing protein